MAFKQWKFTDPYDTNSGTNSYTFPINPNTMTSPFPQRAISSTQTTAVTGQVLLWEGSVPAKSWQFGGVLLDEAQHEALRAWVYERHNRIIVTDHFGRPITCALQQFDAQPKRSVGKYWRHDYTITALVTAVGAPTVGDV